MYLRQKNLVGFDRATSICNEQSPKSQRGAERSVRHSEDSSEIQQLSKKVLGDSTAEGTARKDLPANMGERHRGRNGLQEQVGSKILPQGDKKSMAEECARNQREQ
jgi:hypothetical protein